MEVKKVLNILEETFEVEQDSLKLDDKLSDLDFWDSMAKLSLIVMADDEFNKKLVSADIKKFETIKDIVDYLL